MKQRLVLTSARTKEEPLVDEEEVYRGSADTSLLRFEAASRIQTIGVTLCEKLRHNHGKEVVQKHKNSTKDRGTLSLIS